MARTLKRKHFCFAVTALLCSSPWTYATERALREMQIHKVRELGLEIWVENQPPWSAELLKAATLPRFVVQSPADYYPPAVMTYIGMPGSAVDPNALLDVATTAIRRAAENYNLPGPQRVVLKPTPVSYGAFNGYEATFDGWANSEAVEVKVFVGQAAGGFPVAMQAYTLRGQLAQLREPIRRAWASLKYLKVAQ
jgi:hypothetical protein